MARLAELRGGRPGAAARGAARRGRAARCWCRSWRRSSRTSRCARSGGGCWCSRSTGRTGRRDALAALRRARQPLADELGVDPGPALRALEAEVLAQSPALARRPRSADGPTPHRRRPSAADPAARRPADGAPAARPTSVDRDRRARRRAAQAAVADALAGSRRLVLIEGPAGIGKTRLLAEARRMAAEHGAARAVGARAASWSGVRLRRRPAAVRAGARRPGARATRLLAGAAAAAAAVFDVPRRAGRRARSRSCTGSTG